MLALTNSSPSWGTRRRIEEALGPLEAIPNEHPSEEARNFRFAQGRGIVNFISPVSEPYCGACKRMRLTADGKFHLCLLNDDALDAKQAVGPQAHRPPPRRGPLDPRPLDVPDRGLTGGDACVRSSLRAMRAACRKFMESVDDRGGIVVRYGFDHGHWASWRFGAALGELRATFGLHIAEIASQTGLDVEYDLVESCRPATPKTTTHPTPRTGGRSERVAASKAGRTLSQLDKLRRPPTVHCQSLRTDRNVCCPVALRVGCQPPRAPRPLRRLIPER
jgi:hypothetical protein